MAQSPRPRRHCRLRLWWRRRRRIPYQPPRDCAALHLPCRRRWVGPRAPTLACPRCAPPGILKVPVVHRRRSAPTASSLSWSVSFDHFQKKEQRLPHARVTGLHCTFFRSQLDGDARGLPRCREVRGPGSVEPSSNHALRPPLALCSPLLLLQDSAPLLHASSIARSTSQLHQSTPPSKRFSCALQIFLPVARTAEATD